jgi:hypothetical protein
MRVLTLHSSALISRQLRAQDHTRPSSPRTVLLSLYLFTFIYVALHDTIPPRFARQAVYYTGKFINSVKSFRTHTYEFARR